MTLERVFEPRVIPVATIADPDVAEPLAAALLAGGVSSIEVTFRTPRAPHVVAALAGGELVVGAGTIRTSAQVDEAVGAGARFIVTPCLDAEVVDRCRELDVPVVPGIATATELNRALSFGVTCVKVFPAEQLGGAALIRALAAPFPEATFVPTGGIGPENAHEYLALPCVAAIGGSWMVAPGVVADGDWREVASRTRDAVRMGSG